MSGSNQSAQTGIFGKLGIAAPTNAPGSRNFGLSWTDADGNFWLFGGGYGVGVDTTTSGDLSDLLGEYSDGEWTWMGGSDQVEQPSIFGIKGKAAPGNIPSARSESWPRVHKRSIRERLGFWWRQGWIRTAVREDSSAISRKYRTMANGLGWAGPVLANQLGIYGTHGYRGS